MKVDELLNYMASFYTGWDRQYADDLVDIFELDRSKKIRNLSKGQKARLGLTVAQAHRPELLLLDEPSSGLDPIIRKDILSAIIRTVVDEGRSVLFSSHLLEEVERVCDYLIMLVRGRIVLSASLESILEQHHCLTISMHGPLDHPLNLDAIHSLEQDGSVWQMVCHGCLQTITGQLDNQGVQIVARRGLSLDEIFVARTHDPDFSAFRSDQ
jgi:ABC-2 type transport system ATP-binding protein